MLAYKLGEYYSMFHSEWIRLFLKSEYLLLANKFTTQYFVEMNREIIEELQQIYL